MSCKNEQSESAEVGESTINSGGAQLPSSADQSRDLGPGVHEQPGDGQSTREVSQVGDEPAGVLG